MRKSKSPRQKTSRSNDSTSDALNAAFALLKTRGRSEGELREKLERKGFSTVVIDEAISKLREYGYIDDIALAEHLIDYGRRERHLGRYGLQALLRKRLIPEEIIGQLQFSEDEDRETAFRLLKKKMGSIRGSEDMKRFRRLYGYLSRRGFSGEVIRDVMNEYRNIIDEKEDI